MGVQLVASPAQRFPKGRSAEFARRVTRSRRRDLSPPRTADCCANTASNTDVSAVTGFPEIMDGRVRRCTRKITAACSGDAAPMTRDGRAWHRADRPAAVNLYPVPDGGEAGCTLEDAVATSESAAGDGGAARQNHRASPSSSIRSTTALSSRTRRGGGGVSQETRLRLATQGVAPRRRRAAVASYLERPLAVSGEFRTARTAVPHRLDLRLRRETRTSRQRSM